MDTTYKYPKREQHPIILKMKTEMLKIYQATAAQMYPSPTNTYVGSLKKLPLTLQDSFIS